MLKGLMLRMMVTAIQRMLCSMYGICLDDDDCPDGVCEPALTALAGLDAAEPESTPATMATATGSVDVGAAFAPDWSKLKPLVDATVAFVAALRAFLSIDEPLVGSDG